MQSAHSSVSFSDRELRHIAQAFGILAADKHTLYERTYHEEILAPCIQVRTPFVLVVLT